MTIRSGGRPRDRDHAHPTADDGPFDRHAGRRATEPSEAWQPEYRTRGGGGGSYGGNGNGNGNGYGRRNGRGGGGLGGLVRFLLFALILAAIVLILFVTALRPLVRSTVIGWAGDNPGAIDVPFVEDLVPEDLGDALTKPASTDTTQVSFTVGAGESARSIATRLEEDGLVEDRRAFIIIAVERGLTGQLKTGDFILRKSMTPDELVTALLDPPVIQYVDIDFRTGLRLEQMTAKLQTLDGLTLDPLEFYELAHAPTPDLLEDYDWLELPEGASLEGYLWAGTYRVLPDTTGEELVRLMLDRFRTAIAGRLDVPAERGLTFHQVLALASLVEREAALDEERPLIAGVYQNRINGLLGHGLLQADPTVIYAYDTVQLSEREFSTWREYTFWTVPPEVGMSEITVPAELQGYQTYQTEGLIPGPICTPTLASIDAALAPNTDDGYVFFLAKRDGTNGHAFAKTQAEHDQNRVTYGY